MTGVRGKNEAAVFDNARDGLIELGVSLADFH